MRKFLLPALAMAICLIFASLPLRASPLEPDLIDSNTNTNGEDGPFFDIYSKWGEKEWKKWIDEEVYVLISKEQRQQLLGTPLAMRWLRAQELWRFWGRVSGLGDIFYDFYQERLLLAREAYGNTREDRARILLLFGPSQQIVAVNSFGSARRSPRQGDIVNSSCDHIGNLEFWIWSHIPRLSDMSLNPIVVVFYGSYQPRLWDPITTKDSVLFEKNQFDAEFRGGVTGGSRARLQECSDGDNILRLIYLAESWVGRFEANPYFYHLFPLDPEGIMAESYKHFSLFSPLPHAGDENVLQVDLKTVFGKRPNVTTRGRRVQFQAVVKNPERLEPYVLENMKVFHVEAVWAVFKEGIRYDNIGSVYTCPVESSELILVADFVLKAGSYTVRLKVDDGQSNVVGLVTKDFVVEFTTEVEKESEPSGPPPFAQETQRSQKEVSDNQEAHPKEATAPVTPVGNPITKKDNTFRLISLKTNGPYVIGRKRFIVLGGDIQPAKVEFYLDDRLIITDNKPPFETELDLGSVPKQMIVEAVAYNTEGEEIARREIFLNVGVNRFVLRLEKPKVKDGRAYLNGHIYVPLGRKLDKIDLYVDDKLTKSLTARDIRDNTFYTEIAEAGFVVRALAILDDGSSEESLQLIGEWGFSSSVRVDAVELPVAVLDDNEPVSGLKKDDFTVFEDGVRQELSQFLTGEEVPLSIGVLFDASGSMKEVIQSSQKATLGFLRNCLKQQDKAFLMTFSGVPQLLAGLTSDVEKIKDALLPIYPAAMTALYDSIASAMVQFSGVKGEKILVILTDGQDNASNIKPDELIYALRHSNITIYFLVVGDSRSSDEKIMKEISEATAGRVFFMKKTGPEKFYDRIEWEIRSGYLLVYVSSSSKNPSEFRKVDVRLNRKGLKVRTVDGYYPN